ncbi:uncharacterized protein LOC125824401 isoform X2 [Solanum verrucosum]|uniref:uncharacterized protein LOC125824401 isoform X2 n=1 Tax=Solanum verrucosum TaxID=315347 RepID=UPI0020D1580F|nr:uncharacterized protein LOC125824401 isoform X2 [Solanum verrucosum]
MDYKYESVGDHPAPARPQTMTSYAQHPQPPMSYTQLPSLTYFSQQAIRVSAGYMAPQFENKLDHIQNQPANMREAIWREIEKEKMKEEIIAEEIARRRMLELEVRRELMMERQLAQQSGEGLSPFSSPAMSFSPTLPLLKQQTVVRSVEERIARSLEDRMGRGISVSRLGARNEIGRLEIVPFEERIPEIPFQQRSVEPKYSVLKPVSHSSVPMISDLQSPLEPSKEKDKIILLAKPITSVSGAKRKAVTPPVEVASQPPSSSVPKKNGKEDWSCALCQVSATCERGLNDHLQGKKHKSKEAALREQRNGKNYSIGLFPKKPKINNLSEAGGNVNMEQMVKPKVELLLHNKSGERSSLVILEKEGAEDTITPTLHHNADDLTKSANATPKKQKTSKKKKYKFWCATCKVGALSEVSLEAHRVGKKHKARLLVLSSVAASAAKVESTQTVNEALEEVEETEAVKVESTQTVNEALEEVKETEAAKIESTPTVIEALKEVEETETAKVESTPTVNEALEVVKETEVIDDVGAVVDSINPDEQEEVFTTGDN